MRASLERGWGRALVNMVELVIMAAMVNMAAMVDLEAG